MVLATEDAGGDILHRRTAVSWLAIEPFCRLTDLKGPARTDPRQGPAQRLTGADQTTRGEVFAAAINEISAGDGATQRKAATDPTRQMNAHNSKGVV